MLASAPPPEAYLILSALLFAAGCKSSKPIPIQRTGSTVSRVSTQRVS